MANDNEIKVTVEGFTISHSLDVYRNNEKSSSFVSMNFKISQPVSPEEALILESKYSKNITLAVIYDHLARGTMTIEHASELIEQAKTRHEGVTRALEKKFGNEG